MDGGSLNSSAHSGNFINCFWTEELSGKTTSTVGQKISLSQLYLKSTFESAGWDMENVWQIDENQSAPYLKWAGKREKIRKENIDKIINNK